MRTSFTRPPRLPPTERGSHESVRLFEERMARRQQIADAEVFTEVDADGREWTVRRLDAANASNYDERRDFAGDV